MRTSYRSRLLESTAFGMRVCYFGLMKEATDRPDLWVNLCAAIGVPTNTSIDKVRAKLMEADTSISRGNVQRIREGARSYIDTIQKVSAAAGYEAWELMMPGFDPKQRPSKLVSRPTINIPLAEDVLQALSECKDEKVLKSAEAYLRIHIAPSQAIISGEMKTGGSSNVKLVPDKPNDRAPDATRG